jgi:hypothetical protein
LVTSYELSIRRRRGRESISNVEHEGLIAGDTIGLCVGRNTIRKMGRSESLDKARLPKFYSMVRLSELDVEQVMKFAFVLDVPIVKFVDKLVVE